MTRVALSVMALAAVAACGARGAPAKSEADVKAKSIVGSGGLSLTSACTPTGPEICFNGIDDNCNGILEEGCGMGTGPLQFVVAWGDSPADLDLSVTEPSGMVVQESNRTSPSGLRLDRDCPGAGTQSCYAQNAENIYFEGLEPPPGPYIVKVRLTDAHGAAPPIKARLGARVGSRSYGVDLELSPTDDQKTFTFTL